MSHALSEQLNMNSKNISWKRDICGFNGML